MCWGSWATWAPKYMLQSPSKNIFRGEMMGKREDGGIRTVECLRGRLLAERVASKAAKERSDLMAKRLDELEKQLAEEIKSRNRAEKRLKYALKKLKSLKLPILSESSAGSSSSRQCGSGRESEETKRVMGEKDVEKDDGLDSSLSDSANQTVSLEGSWSSVGTAHSWSKETPPRDEDSNVRDSEESITDAARQALDKVDETKNADSEHSNEMLALVPLKNDAEFEDYNNPLALVPMKSCSDDNGNNVHDVLVALRHVREQLRNSLERRALRVG